MERPDLIAAAEENRRVTPLLPDGPKAPKPAGPSALLDTFYSGDVAMWRTVLGEGLHYHHGLFADPPAPEPTDAEMLAAVRRAVEELYSFIPPASRVYDLGCGWGGPLAMLVCERGCEVTGVTAARGQFEHAVGQGFKVLHADAEQTLPPGDFDSVLMLESFEHIQEKSRLLRLLRPVAPRLVMRTNCQDAAPAEVRFGGTMPMVSSTTLRALLTEAGWTIRHWRDRRAEAMPSAAFWRRRLRSLPPGGDLHMDVLRVWCDRIVTLGDAWGRCNPLIEVVAD